MRMQKMQMSQIWEELKLKTSWQMVHDNVPTSWGYGSTGPALVNFLLVFVFILYNDKYNMHGG